MLVLNKNEKKNLLLQFVSGLGGNRYFDWTIRQNKVGGVIFKIFYNYMTLH